MVRIEAIGDCPCEGGLVIPEQIRYNPEARKKLFLEGYVHKVVPRHIKDGVLIGGFKDSRENLLAVSNQINSLGFLRIANLYDEYRHLTISGISITLPQDAFPDQFRLENGDQSSKSDGLRGTLQEQHLIEWSIQGDGEAFGGLYDHLYKDIIYKHMYYRTRNPEDAEDLTAQVFLNAWGAIGRYRQMGKPLGSWLLSIGHNLLVNHYRAKKDIGSLDTNGEKFSGDDSDPEVVVEKKMANEALGQAISRLPKAQGDLVSMYYLKEMDNREIAARLGKSEGAVRQLCTKAISNLRAYLISGKEIEEIPDLQKDMVDYAYIARERGFGSAWVQKIIRDGEKKNLLYLRAKNGPQGQNRRFFDTEDKEKIDAFLDFLGYPVKSSGIDFKPHF